MVPSREWARSTYPTSNATQYSTVEDVAEGGEGRETERASFLRFQQFLSESDERENQDHGRDKTESTLDHAIEPVPGAARDKKGRSNGGTVRFKELLESDPGKVETYPADSYSFLAINSPFKKPAFFAFGLMVFLFQMTFLILLIMSRFHFRYVTGEKDNPSENPVLSYIPSNVSSLARATQIVGVLSYCVFADSSLKDIATAVEQFPRFDRDREEGTKWCGVFSCALRMIQGLLATLCALLLIITSAEVVDIILNFTAVNFISNLDEVAFDLAKWGKYGPTLEKEARCIETRKIPYCIYREHHHKRYLFTIVLIAMIMLGVLIATIVTQNHFWRTEVIRVQFRDWTGFHSYSGCYRRDPDIRHDGRYVYNSYNGSGPGERPGFFRYCKEDQHWVLFNPDLVENEGDVDPCDSDELPYSSDTDSFDISTSFDQLWFLPNGRTLNFFFFEEEEEIMEHCNSSLEDGRCDHPFFNTLGYEYDFGDCCASTCSRSNCGAGGVTSAFGVEGKIGYGYPNCQNPIMVAVTILLSSIKNNREIEKSRVGSMVYNATESMLDEFYLEKGLNFLDETPVAAYFLLECDGSDVLLIPVDDDMQNKTETVMVKDGARCDISVSNRTNDYDKWSNDPIWWVNYTVYHGDDTTNEIVSGDSGYERSVDFHRIPECYFDKLKDWVKLPTAYFANETSTQALKWLVEDTSGYSSCGAAFFLERFALVALNLAAPIHADTNETADTLWISTQQHCRWQSVGCEDGSISSISIRDKELSGTLASSVGLLTELESMEYDGNNLLGTIPSEIGLLTKLIDLDIDDNKLTGSIPTELGNLTNLIQFDLDGNHLNGTIPTEFGRMTKARKIELDDNELSGLIPTEFGNLPNLIQLDLDDNHLNGTIPTEFGGMTKAQIIELSDNYLSGSIPSEIGRMKELEDFQLANNELTGAVPTQLGKLTKLKRLQLEDNYFTGSIPTEIGLMTSLSSMDLRGNSLNGSIPSEIGFLPNLAVLRLEGNDFTGTIPVEVDSLEKLEIITYDDSLTDYLPGNINTMYLCVLCHGSNDENNSNYYVLYKNGTDSCSILLDEQEQDTTELTSAEACNVLKETCIACSMVKAPIIRDQRSTGANNPNKPLS